MNLPFRIIAWQHEDRMYREWTHRNIRAWPGAMAETWFGSRFDFEILHSLRKRKRTLKWTPAACCQQRNWISYKKNAKLVPKNHFFCSCSLGRTVMTTRKLRIICREQMECAIYLSKIWKLLKPTYCSCKTLHLYQIPKWIPESIFGIRHLLLASEAWTGPDCNDSLKVFRSFFAPQIFSLVSRKSRTFQFRTRWMMRRNGTIE